MLGRLLGAAGFHRLLEECDKGSEPGFESRLRGFPRFLGADRLLLWILEPMARGGGGTMTAPEAVCKRMAGRVLPDARLCGYISFRAGVIGEASAP